MAKIEQFPSDDSLWFVKWADEFRSPHLGTTSASVGVLLQKLPFNKHQLSRMDEDTIQAVFSDKSNNGEAIFFESSLMQSQEGKPNLSGPTLPRVHVGTLPLIQIGMVYQHKEFVGMLPISSKKIGLNLPSVEESCEEVALGDLLPQPKNWNPDYPYRILNQFEYSGISKRFPRSRCLVYRTHTTDFVIPRTTIFTRFYAPHLEMAKAFTNGPWSKEFSKVICMEEMESGLITQIDPETGNWHIILQTTVLDPYARILAIHHFDRYGKACAESIYANAIKDRGKTITNPWYASAKLPFEPCSTPLRLTVRGYYLKHWSSWRNENSRNKFLVTSISECTLPPYLPPIKYERRNSGETGDTVEQTDQPAPYAGRKLSKHAGKQATIDATRDASETSQSTDIPIDDFTWTDAPPLEKIKKISSKRYQSPTIRTGGDDTRERLSSGNRTYREDSLPQAETKILVRSQSKRFRQLLDALSDLAENGKISNFSILQPNEPTQLILRGSDACWNFFEAKSRDDGFWPRRGWRMIGRETGQKGTGARSFPRSALIVEIEVGKLEAIWIEIECRPKSEHYRSPLIIGLIGKKYEAVALALKLIAEKKGLNCRPTLHAHMIDKQFGAKKVVCFTHKYRSRDSDELAVKSVGRFIKKHMGKCQAD